MPDIIQQFLAPGVQAGTLESRPGPEVLGTSDSVATFGRYIPQALGPRGSTIGPMFDGDPIAEPQRTYDYRVILPNIGTEVPIAEGIDINVIETTSQSPEPIGGRHRYVANTYDAPPLTLILYHNQASDSIAGHIALNYIHYWQRLVQNDDGTYNYPETYLFSIYFNFLNVDQTIGFTLEYRKCFPLTAAPIPMRYNRSDRTAITVTFSVERVIKTVVGSSTAASVTPSILNTNRLELPNDPSFFQSLNR
jgi:hypothetical protein